ncbi:MAG: PTS-dependent dihydroxyacetone kinase phosphotransferase subunit DhaM, partial [Verrucomicrobia bacterium]|nr:PTS-dependent dihydroxyacetone kinase phosphotransferase subunit DhaM [Verrucomicrobiota bacterium]
MVGIVVVSHSRALAEAIVDLVNRTTSTKVPIRFSGGTGAHKRELGTDAAEIYGKILEVYSDDGVLVLMDMGSAVLSAETAKDFLNPEQKEKVLLASAPLVEGAISAAVPSKIGASLQMIAKAAHDSLLPKQEHLV